MLVSPELIAAARGDKPAELLLKNARMLNVFSGQIEETDIALFQGRIAGIGRGYAARETVDLAGAYVAPGLIDAHVHIESSLCMPAQFAAAVLPRGVTTVVTDPHEIANVAGMDGVRFMAESSRALPLNVVIMAPSCVPATHMETSGAALDDEDLQTLLAEGVVHGLAEVMNFPGVVGGDPDVLRKLVAFGGRALDGHAPALRGPALNAYVAAGIGSEHECTTVEEAAEKLARGLYILIREATNAHNLHNLLPLITPENSRRICFCTDDRMPGDLLTQGSIDYMVREAIAFGIAPITAWRMATLNTAEWFGLHDRGAIAPGRVADLMIFDDLQKPQARMVYAAGRLVAEAGELVANVLPPATALPQTVAGTINVSADIDFAIPARGHQIRVIGSLPDQLVTAERILDARLVDGLAVADPERDILKMAVIDRHTASGATGLGFIQGFGLQRGAIAGTVAHDHHNLVVIGIEDEAMRAAAEAVINMQGGLVVIDRRADGALFVAAQLPLSVAGLMSDRPIAEVRQGYDALLAAAAQMGAVLHDPFMAMSFMALEVIPKLKLTDQGLVDVEQFGFVDLFVSEGNRE
ncbi:MAG: adenine deaminase [Caldilineaceae bacterium]